jgi:hypothetical protein
MSYLSVSEVQFKVSINMSSKMSDLRLFIKETCIFRYLNISASTPPSTECMRRANSRVSKESK